jgi:hypothetical protein
METSLCGGIPVTSLPSCGSFPELFCLSELLFIRVIVTLYFIHKWKCSPWINNISIRWGIVRVAKLQACPQIYLFRELCLHVKVWERSGFIMSQ